MKQTATPNLSKKTMLGLNYRCLMGMCFGVIQTFKSISANANEPKTLKLQPHLMLIVSRSN